MGQIKPTEAEIRAVVKEQMSDENKITFTDEQQEKVNQLIREKQGEATRPLKTELDSVKTNLATLQAELQAAKEALTKATTTAGKKEASDEVESLKSQISEMKTIKDTLLADVQKYQNMYKSKEDEVAKERQNNLSIRKQIAIANATSKIGFIDNSVVSKLTAENVSYDEAKGKFVVLNDDGQPKLNSAFEQMSLEEYYTEYAAKNPYLVKPDARSGGGSQSSQKSTLSADGKFTIEQIFGPKSNAVAANQLAQSNPQEYRRLKGLAKTAGLIA